MKKFLYLFCFALCSVLLLTVSSCKVNVENSQKKLGSGTIIGRVFYTNNMSDSTGIHVLLVPSDGLRAVSSSDRRVTASATEVDEVISDKDGNYTFTNVPVGTYSIYASFSSTTEKAVITRISVKKNETSFANDLKLTQTGSISGVITLDDSPSNNNGFTVFIGGTTFVSKTDLKGNYKIEGIPAGKDYELFIEKGLFTFYKGNVEVAPDKNTEIETINFTSEQINESNKGSGAQDGKDGISIVWKGQFESAGDIANPKYAWAYYNTTDGCSYIYDGTNWTLLAKAGADGEKGDKGDKGDQGIQGEKGDKGDTGEKGDKGEKGDTGEKGSSGSNGSNGSNGTSIVWLGEFAAASDIANPVMLNAFYNTTNGCSYIYTSTGWSLLAKAGAKGETGDKGDKGDTGATGQGEKGDAGVAGASMIWRGSFDSAEKVTNPVLLNAYYNISDGCSYIYTSEGWTLLAAKGSAGNPAAQMNWKGSFETAPANPQELWAYYNTAEGKSYLYCNNQWNVIAVDGADGVDGKDNTGNIYTIVATDIPAGDSNLPAGGVKIEVLKNGEIIDTKYVSNGADGTDGVDGNDGAISICYINYVLNGGSLGNDSPDYVLYGETISLVEAERVGYVFSGWYDNRDLNGTPLSTFASDGTTASVTLYAKWRLNNTTTYTITLDNQSATTAGTTDFTIKCGSVIESITIPVKNGYLFNGYYTEKNGQGLKCINEDGTGNGTWSVAGDRSVYAYWTPVLYRIYLDNQEATTDGSLYAELNYGNKLPDIIIPGKTGLVFMGYYTQANGTGTKYYDDKGHGLINSWTDTSVNTLYALWAEASTIAVSELRNFLSNVVASEGPYYLRIADKNPDLTELSTILKTYEHIKVILDFSECIDLTAITENAFQEVNNIVELKTGSSISTIDKKAFYKCTGLEKVIIGNNVSSIGVSAFDSCSNLQTVEMGDSVSIINSSAFYSCKKLVNVTMGENVTSIGYNSFANCFALENIILPDTLTTVGEQAFKSCNMLQSIIIPDSVISIGNSAFNGCSKLGSVTFGNSVETIGDKAFFECGALADIFIPESVTSIGTQVFYSCENLQSIEVALANTVYESLESNVIIEEATRTLMYGCTNSKIPENTLIIGDYAFYNYKNLTEITIPSSVKEIRSNAFRLTGLTSVKLPSNLTVLGDYAFASSQLTSVSIPSGVKEIGKYAFYYCESLTSVNLGSAVTIGVSAFYNTGLTAVTIPSTVTKIENYAFGKTKISKVTIPSSVLWIGMGTFAGSPLTSATFTATSSWYYTTGEANWNARVNGSYAVLNSDSNRIGVLTQANYYYYFSNK